MGTADMSRHFGNQLQQHLSSEKDLE